MAEFQILYPSGSDGKIHNMYREESSRMSSFGFIIGTEESNYVSHTIYRGFMIKSQDSYPKCRSLIQSWGENRKTLYMSDYFPIIEDLSIPTVFIPELDLNAIIAISQNHRWPKVFIKSDGKSLFGISDVASVWPDTSIQTMIKEYAKRNLKGPFAVREFINNPQIFYNEQRYWVLNGNSYHPSEVVPDFVAEAAKRIYHFSGSHYFTIDVAGNYIVEVNPGESSDRGGDNPLDFFCEIFAKEFLNNPLYDN